MAEKKRLLDVWIGDTNTVYREVPFAVVTDWLQEGRVLAQDRVRVSGTSAWRLAGNVPAFGPFLPKAELNRAEDKAEALEPVETGFHWKSRTETEDEDVDMIPLIDISLVLLIFFMMTASVSSGLFSPINTPGAKHQLATITKDMFWVGIDIKGPDGKIENGENGQPMPWYSLGKENQQLLAPRRDLNEVLDNLEKTIDAAQGDVRVRLRADRTLKIEAVNAVTLELQGLENRINRQRGKQGRLTFAFSAEVSEPQGK